ncbi:hypothetical protein BDZ91DRAFT_763425 [Kalaharituber pfeilii]|nr:hypothetical protein BDZ91DRAFT_763425 [Kalaharituber pfeilii]
MPRHVLLNVLSSLAGRSSRSTAAGGVGPLQFPSFDARDDGVPAGDLVWQRRQQQQQQPPVYAVACESDINGERIAIGESLCPTRSKTLNKINIKRRKTLKIE